LDSDVSASHYDTSSHAHADVSNNNKTSFAVEKDSCGSADVSASDEGEAMEQQRASVKKGSVLQVG
jgi:hypothetical protein